MDKYIKKPDNVRSGQVAQNNNNDDQDESLPAILNGKYFEIVSNENGKVKADCLMCRSDGKKNSN